MVNPVSKVFECQDLRLLIWSYALPRRCNSCHQKLTKPLKPLYTHHKDYNNTHWRSAEKSAYGKGMQLVLLLCLRNNLLILNFKKHKIFLDEKKYLQVRWYEFSI